MAELAVVTGGSRGIGAAIALKLGGLGYHVVLTYTRDATAAERVIHTIVAAGGKAQAMQLDIACEQQVLTLFNMLDQQGEQLTLLVNNAGITEGFCRLEALTFEQLQRVFQVNVFGAFLCAREAVRRMGYSRGGHGGQSSTFLRVLHSWVAAASGSITPPPRARSIASPMAWLKK